MVCPRCLSSECDLRHHKRLWKPSLDVSFLCPLRSNTARSTTKSIGHPNNPVQDLFTARNITLLTRKKLLIEVVNIAAFRKGFCNLIEAENLLHLEDLARLNLEEMKAKHQIGPSVLAEITGLMLHLGLGDRHKIFFLATKHHFSPKMPHGAIL